jgi:hypothetical protein
MSVMCDVITPDNVFSAAETNDCEKLIGLLCHKSLSWVPQFRTSLADGLSALETVKYRIF